VASNRKKKKESPPSGAPQWMVTYGDLMSLLLTFFVLLLSFSTMAEPQKFHDAIMSIRTALGVLPDNVSMQFRPQDHTSASNERMRRMARELRRRLQVTGQDTQVDVKMHEQEGILQITLPNTVLFDSGSAQLRQGSETIMQAVSEVLNMAPTAFIEVRGHTDDIPIGAGSPFRDNFDLSYSRSKAVVESLHAIGQLPLRQFEMIACGPSQPIATNDTPEGRAENRRVELFIRGDLSDDAIDQVRRGIEGLQTVPVEPARPPAILP